MKILPNYLLKTVLASILMTLLILMGIEILIALIDQLSSIGTGQYTLLAAIKFVFLDMPYQLSNFFPMAGLIGTLLGLGVLANQSELIVMRAGGISILQISWNVLKAGIIIMIIAVLLGECLAPGLEQIANNQRAWLKSGGKTSLNNGMWLREKNNFIHVGQIINKQHLADVQNYRFDDQHQLQLAQLAQKADFEQGRWVLKDVHQNSFLPDKITTDFVAKLPWNISLNPNLLKLSNVEPRNMTLPKLMLYIHYLQANNLRASIYQLNFWKRIVQPFATLIMIFLAVPFVFGSLRTTTMGVRILMGITIGFIFYILNQLFGPFCLLLQWPPILGALFPSLCFLLLGLTLTFRKR